MIEALRKENNLGFPKQHAISRREGSGPAVLSYAQRSMWFFSQLEGSEDVYNLPSCYHLQGLLNIQALEDSLNEIVQRHEVLHTTFAEIAGEARQVVAPQLQIKTGLIDLRTIPEEQSEPEARRILLELGRKSFDLSHGPLIRVNLLQLDEQEFFLHLNMHHIVIDEWSLELLFAELQQLYSARQSGRSADLPDIPIQYADYAAWQAEWLRGDVVEKQLAYWKNRLAGSPQIIELKTDFPRPAVQSYRGNTVVRQLSKQLLNKLQQLGKDEQVTLFTTLLAAFKVLLYRYTGQADVVVGTPVSNRRQVELEKLIGFFLNTLVLRSDLSGSPSFRQVLKRVVIVLLEGFENKDLPFEKLVEELNPQRDLSHHPLFQVAFVLHSIAVKDLKLPGLEISKYDLDYGWSKFDLTMFLTEQPDGLEMIIEYSTDLFTQPTIERMAGHYETLLQEIAANPDCSIDRLQLLGAAERQMLLFDWNRSCKIYARDLLVHQLVEAQALQNPDAVALLASDQQPAAITRSSMTYGELNRRANQIAHYLRQRGIGPECIIGVFMQRSPTMVAALLGVLKAGGAYLPLDLANPPERLAFMVRDAGVQLILSQAALIGSLEGLESQVIYLDRDWELFRTQPAVNPENLAGLHNRAYIIYTSGSTGQPKGVELEHGGLLNLVHWHNETFEITAADRATQVAGLSFDASVWEIWPYLVQGARVYLLMDEKGLSAERLVEWLVANAITISFLPTPVVETVLNMDWPEGTTLRALLTGGDRLHILPSSRLPFHLVNNYGPTECTVVATSGVVRALSEADSTRVAESIGIGRPIANTQLYVLDRFLNPAPVGVAGELYIGGAGVGRGYLNRPGLTAEKFVPNPFLDLSAQQSNVEMVGVERLYRTGDLVRYLPDGELEFLGRTDTQVKLRGLRIELGEIENVLIGHPQVKQVVVNMHRRESAAIGGERDSLVAYIVPEQACSPEKKDLRDYIKSKLPEYMLPSEIIFLNSMPLSPNGKIDRQAILALNVSQVSDKEYLAPATPLEQVLARIWREILKVEQVGLHDNFFELGGNSMLAIRLADRIEDLLQTRIDLHIIFQASELQDFVNALLEGPSEVSLLQEIAQLLIELDSLSEDEVQASLVALESEKKVKS